MKEKIKKYYDEIKRSWRGTTEACSAAGIIGEHAYGSGNEMDSMKHP